jgi:hypothetical protein
MRKILREMFNISRKQMNARFLQENLKAKDNMRHLGIHGRIILKSRLNA